MSRESQRRFILTTDPWNSPVAPPVDHAHAVSSSSSSDPLIRSSSSRGDGALGLAIRKPQAMDKCNDKCNDNNSFDKSFDKTTNIAPHDEASNRVIDLHYTSANDHYHHRNGSGLHTPPLSDSMSERSLSSLVISLKEQDLASSPGGPYQSAFSLLSRESSPWRGSSRSASPSSLTNYNYNHNHDHNQNTANSNTTKARTSSVGTDSIGSLTSSGLHSDLIMPSVSVSTARPFTENGLKLGKLKLLVAGDSNVGKTLLLNALAHYCVDIVHVDDADTFSVRVGQEFEAELSELTASTKPMPFYEARPKPKPKTSAISSNKDDENTASTTAAAAPLDRNISLIDTPGYSAFSDPTLCIDLITTYLDERFRDTASTVNVARQQTKAINLMASASSLNQFSHVDAVLYVLDGLSKPCDLDFMAKLSQFACVIPVISKADKHGTINERLRLKRDLLSQMKQANVKPFLFGQSLNESIELLENALQSLEMCENGLAPEPMTADASSSFDESQMLPFCISTWHDETQDLLASVLMAPDYRPTLSPSDLDFLMSCIYSPHGSTRLRHETAKVFLDWCASLQLCQSLSPVVSRPAGLYNARDIYVDESFLKNSYSYTIPGTISGVVAGSVPGPVRSRAQQQTARWVMQLEQVSRTENAVSIRARTSTSSRRRVRLQQQPQNYASVNSTSTSTSASAPNGKFLSSSIVNKDPLGLKNLPKTIMNWVLKASSFIVGLGTFYYLTRSKEPVVVQPASSSLSLSLSVFDMDALSQKVSQTVTSALGSLGGGWSMIA